MGGRQPGYRRAFVQPAIRVPETLPAAAAPLVRAPTGTAQPPVPTGLGFLVRSSQMLNAARYVAGRKVQAGPVAVDALSSRAEAIVLQFIREACEAADARARAAGQDPRAVELTSVDADAAFRDMLERLGADVHTLHSLGTFWPLVADPDSH